MTIELQIEQQQQQGNRNGKKNDSMDISSEKQYFGTVPSSLVTIVINVTLMFNSFWGFPK